MGRYILEGGGKRIRPALLLLACRACGYRGDRAILLASVVELIHTATLVHDDIIDEATVRRGRRSANSRWGNDITVLLGDFLYTKSMSLALSQDNLPILRVLSDVTLRMIEGQLLEIEGNGDIDIGEEGHLDIIRRKTADLFSACLRIGAMLSAAGDAPGGGARALRPEPRHLLPDGRRPARLHGRGAGGGQAGRQRPARGQAHAARHLHAAPRRRQGRRARLARAGGPRVRAGVARGDRGDGARARRPRRGARSPSATPTSRGRTWRRSSRRPTARRSKCCPTSSWRATTRTPRSKVRR